jgi:hypothetical protein
LFFGGVEIRTRIMSIEIDNRPTIFGIYFILRNKMNYRDSHCIECDLLLKDEMVEE